MGLSVRFASTNPLRESRRGLIETLLERLYSRQAANIHVNIVKKFCFVSFTHRDCIICGLILSYNPRCNMAKKKRVKKPVDYSLAQLQQLVESKQSELSDRKAKRAELQKQLSELDQRISQAEGNGRAVSERVSAKPAAPKKRVAVKKRAENERTGKTGPSRF